VSTLNILEVKVLLDQCKRNELRDHAFGDREIYWLHPTLGYIAFGYSGPNVEFTMNNEKGEAIEFNPPLSETDIRSLFTHGNPDKIIRNDSTGPDTYQEGKVMPGLTLEGVLREITET